MPVALWAGLTGGVGGLLIILLAAPADLFGRVPALTGTMTVPARNVAVVDGETLLMNQTIVRLQGVAAPTRGKACNGDDGNGVDCGSASASSLAALVRNRDVTCKLSGRDSEGFARGVCEAAGTELNRAQVAAGWAKARSGAQQLASDEAAARSAHRGVWR